MDMNPIEQVLGALDQMILRITALEGPTLLIVTLWMTGYGVKIIGRIPNDWIPRVNLALAMFMTPFVVRWPDAGAQPPVGVPYPEVTAWVQTEARAVLFWSVAWLTHAKLLKKWIDVKLNGNGNSNGKPSLPSETDKPTAPVEPGKP